MADIDRTGQHHLYSHKINQLTRFDANELHEFFGYEPPRPLVDALRSSADLANKQNVKIADLWDDAVGIVPAGLECAYTSTPPELFPFGRTFVDGVHVGLINLAPELKPIDLPIGTWSPMDIDDGVNFVRNSVWQGLASELGQHIHYGRDYPGEVIGDDAYKLALKLARHWNIVEETQREADWWNSEANKTQWTPVIPNDWAFVRNSDNLGSLAPREAFESTIPVVWAARSDVNDLLDKAEDSLRRDYPGTSLLYSREARHQSHTTEHHQRCREIGAAAYAALGRDGLAEIHRERQQESMDILGKRKREDS